MPSPQQISAAQASKIAEFELFIEDVDKELVKLGEAYMLTVIEVPGNATYTSIFSYAMIRFPEIAPYWDGYAVKQLHVDLYAGRPAALVARTALRQAQWLRKYFPDEVLKPQSTEE